MKKRFLFLPIVIALFSACTSDDPIVEEKPVIPQQPSEIPETPQIPETPTVPDPDDSQWELTSNINLTASESAVLGQFNQFSYELMDKLNAKEDGNFCCSPISVSIYLSMLANAADEETRDQILSALHVDDMATVNSLNQKLMHYLPCEDLGSALSINNRFWVADRHSINPEFISTIQTVFNGDVESVDFSNPSTVPSINKWVSDKTKGLIQSILDGDWTKYILSDMASANTVYFKGNWSKKFETSDTRSKTFHGTKGDKTIEMMHQTIYTLYASNDKFEMVFKDFEDHSVRAEFYLPDENLAPSEYMAILTPDMQNKLINFTKECKAELTFPKYNSASNSDLASVMETLGVNLQTANLSTMGIHTAPLNLNHKTSIKFNEEGAEFAAVTDVWLGAPPVPTYIPKVKMEFNRPFVYIIRNINTGMILMAGVVTNI